MRTLKMGSKGAEVSDLQTRLKKLGYKLDVDGVFGNVTYSTVKLFQAKYKLTVDGIVGEDTWKQLKLLTNKDYKAIGQQVEKCLSDIGNLPSVKKLVNMLD